MQKNGDSERYLRYAELLNKYKGNIVGFCVRRCGSGAEADDLMQEVFVALWEGLGSLRDGCPPGMENRWMYKVMRTAWSRHRRHRSRTVTLPPERLPDMAAPHNDNAETVDEMLAALDTDAERLVRRHMEGYSSAELAAELGMKTETVRKRIARAIKKMRNSNKNHGQQ